jgi:hypothetical protein
VVWKLSEHIYISFDKTERDHICVSYHFITTYYMQTFRTLVCLNIGNEEEDEALTPFSNFLMVNGDVIGQ